MSHVDDDIPEFVGGDRKTRAEPVKSKNTKAAALAVETVAAPKAAARAAEPVAPQTEPEVEVTPFDQFGKIVSPPVEVVAKLKPEVKARLMALLQASVEAEEAEQTLADTEKTLYATVSEAHRKRVHYEHVRPQTTHVDELRRVIAARQGRPLPPPEVDPNAEKAAIALDEAEVLVSTLRADLESARLIVKSKRTTLSEAYSLWMGYAPKRDVADLVRENIAREQARKLARVAQGLAPEEEPPPHHHVEPIDQVMSSHRGSVNVNWRRPPGSWRGAPSAKVPSQR